MSLSRRARKQLIAFGVTIALLLIIGVGGNQLRLTTILGGTAVAQTVRRCNARGTHVAGTSAGAAFVSEHMIGDELAWAGLSAGPVRFGAVVAASWHVAILILAHRVAEGVCGAVRMKRGPGSRRPSLPARGT